MATVDVRGTPVYFLRGGSGRPLLFVHGSGGDHMLWGHQFQGLKRTYTIAALDLNGHGRSFRRAGDGLKTYTEDVLAIMDAMGEPVVIMGHSLGGAVVLNVALREPRLLRGIGLIGTGAKLRVHPDILSAIERDFETAVDLILSWAFSDAPSDDVYQKTRQRMLDNGRQALLRDFQTCDRFDVRERLGEIDVPALVVCGRQDRLTPVKYAEYLHDRLAHSYLEVIEGAGHNVMLQRPEELNAAIRDFMNRLE